MLTGFQSAGPLGDHGWTQYVSLARLNASVLNPFPRFQFGLGSGIRAALSGVESRNGNGRHPAAEQMTSTLDDGTRSIRIGGRESCGLFDSRYGDPIRLWWYPY
jgi:hypothetical protein